MKTSFLIKHILCSLPCIAGLCTSLHAADLPVNNQGHWVEGNEQYDNITVTADGTTTNEETNETKGAQSFIQIEGNASLTATNITLTTQNGAEFASLYMLGGNLNIKNITLTSGITDPYSASNLNLSGGTSQIDEIIAEGYSYIYIAHGDATIGSILGGKNSTVQIGSNELPGGTLTLNGTITTGSFSFGDSFVSLTFGDGLFNCVENGIIKVISYESLIDIDGSRSTHDTTMEYLEAALNAYKEKPNSDYDLTNAQIVSITNETGGEFRIEGIQSIPEPSTTTLGLLGLAALLIRRRR